MAETSTEDQRTDAEETDDTESTTPESPEETARLAAQRLAQTQDEDTPPPDPDDEEETTPDEEVSDEEVKAWLKDVVQTPEIKQVIRETAREVSARVKDKTTREVRAEVESEFEKRLNRVEADLRSGSLTPDEATAAAQDAAERAARSVARETDDEDTSEADALVAAREARLRLRELEAYKREALASLDDRSTLVEEIIVVTADMSEDDIDDLIDKSKEIYTKVRKTVISELRRQGWKSPRDLQRLAAEYQTPDEDTDDDEDEETAPPTRDRRSSQSLSPKRRQGLRERFGYGKTAR